jgi:hypothetical protein
MTTITAQLNPARAGVLRAALTLDAVVTAANGAAYLAAFALLDDALGVPQALLIGVGAFLLAYAAFVGRLASAQRPNRTAVVAVIAANAVWALDSVLLLAVDGFTPTLAGQIVVAVQAAGVAALAGLQYAGLRRA